MKKIKILFFTSVFSLFYALPALAQYGLKETAGAAGLNTKQTSLPDIIGSVIGYFLGFLGVLFLILMIYGGYLWMTSFGSAEKTKKAKDLIVDAVIGLVIVLAAYAITNFVIGALVGKSTT
ncbi:pilin [Patescibacteria group bacterium]|nr:pilin [Patescibacteria group bacterium]